MDFHQLKEISSPARLYIHKKDVFKLSFELWGVLIFWKSIFYRIFSAKIRLILRRNKKQTEQKKQTSWYCYILALNPAVNQETGASGRRYRGITLIRGRVEFGEIATPTGSRWMSNNYITRCHRRLELSWSSSCSSRQWKPAPYRGLRLSGPRFSNPAEWGSAALIRGIWGQYVAVCSISNSPLTRNQYQPFRNPFENKMWEVYFSKELCSFVDYVSACICIRIVESWLYNNMTSPSLLIVI